ncbi:MAG: hypothetical protein ACPHXR_04570 [Flavicella sp.]
MKTSKIIFDQALVIYFGIVIYFFLMQLLGLETITELRALNFLFVAYGVNAAIKKNVIENADSYYFTNLYIGFSTAFFAVLAVAFSLILYITFINVELITLMESSSVWGNDLTLGMVIFAILIEGLASSAICSFIVMQYWKKYKVKSMV